jgi:hypothetical protein
MKVKTNTANQNEEKNKNTHGQRKSHGTKTPLFGV